MPISAHGHAIARSLLARASAVEKTQHRLTVMGMRTCTNLRTLRDSLQAQSSSPSYRTQAAAAVAAHAVVAEGSNPLRTETRAGTAQRSPAPARQRTLQQRHQNGRPIAA